MQRGHKGLSRPKKREKALKGKGIPRPKKSIEEILEKIIDEPFGVGFEAEFNSIHLCSTSDYTQSPDWLQKKYKQFVNGGAIYTFKQLTLTTEESKTENCFDIEAQIGVFRELSLPGFKESCQSLKLLLDTIRPITSKDSNSICKVQMTLSFHISKYPSIFSFYYQDIPFYKELYDGLKKETKYLGDTVFGFILYTSYYFIKLQAYRKPSLIVKNLLLLQKQLENITKEINMLVEKQKVSWTSEMQQNISLLGLKRTTLIKQIKDFKTSIGDDSNLDVLPVIRQSIFKSNFPLKPRTNIYELFLELSKDEQSKIMEFNFNMLTDFDESIIWDMTPMQLFYSLRETPANKIAGMVLPLNEIFEFCKEKKRLDLWDQSVEEGGKTYYSKNFVNLGQNGFIAIEFRDFKKVAKLAGYKDNYKDGLTIDEFQDRVGVTVDNFLTPFFSVKKSALKYKKSLKKIPMKSKSKKSKTKERNKICKRGSKSGQKIKR
jgi:hypothetical protein